MPDTYVLVHGAWHTGAEMEATATHLRARGHAVHCPTLAGNHPGDNRAATGLADAVDSLAAFIDSHGLTDVRLVGHSYGGMVISHMPARLPGLIRRLVYWNAFVPQPGECLNDLVPPHYRALFDQVAASNGNAVMLPYPIWREAFINDADEALAKRWATISRDSPRSTGTAVTEAGSSVSGSGPMRTRPSGPGGSTSWASETWA